VLTLLRISDAVVSLPTMQRFAGPCAQRFQRLWRVPVRVRVRVRVELCLVRLVAVGAAAQYKTSRHDGERNTHGELKELPYTPSSLPWREHLSIPGQGNLPPECFDSG
jgi:hypothetical protein